MRCEGVLIHACCIKIEWEDSARQLQVRGDNQEDTPCDLMYCYHDMRDCFSLST